MTPKWRASISIGPDHLGVELTDEEIAELVVEAATAQKRAERAGVEERHD